ncbi:MAG TPA: GNAT family N-acetyltransferase [Methylomirabilota bacterium]|nr:GNAT family N-acetyltransferase [Methylomirabilota bacterium]
MALRKHRPGELVIEQTRDLDQVREMIESAGMMTEGIEWPAACYILAYNGDEAIGVVGVEAKIDAALIRSLYVKPAMRQRGIGAALLAAARKAAHTRGAVRLYLFSTDAGSFFERQGFVRAEVATVIGALSGVPQVEHYRARPDELAREVAYHLDISGDGVIER